jgi:uncharacterized repeat protein (TIGR03803 family)
LPSGERLENVMFASDGNYYGVAQALLGSDSYVFRATSSGTFTTIYTFPAGTFTSGFRATPLLEADDGNFYGSTATGGANGSGMIYKLTPAGQFTLLHSFEKGKYPSGPTTLIEASDGNLYGDALSPDLAGQIFRITKSGQYTLLHQMTGPGAGGCPCWLVQGSDGIVYGMAHTGGTSGDGLVFALDAGLPIPKPRAQSFSRNRAPRAPRYASGDTTCCRQRSSSTEYLRPRSPTAGRTMCGRRFRPVPLPARSRSPRPAGQTRRKRASQCSSRLDRARRRRGRARPGALLRQAMSTQTPPICMPSSRSSRA